MSRRVMVSLVLGVLTVLGVVGVVGLGWGPPPGYCKPTTHSIGYTTQVVWPACPAGTAPGLEVAFNGLNVTATAKCVQLGGGNPPWIWPTSQSYIEYNVTIEIQELGWSTAKHFNNTQPTQFLFLFYGSNSPEPTPNMPYIVHVDGQASVYPVCQNTSTSSGSGGDDTGSTGKVLALAAGAGAGIIAYVFMLRGGKK